MSEDAHNWIGNIVSSRLDGIYDADGVKHFDLLECKVSTFDALDRPQLFSVLGTTEIEKMETIDPDSINSFRLVSDIGEIEPESSLYFYPLDRTSDPTNPECNARLTEGYIYVANEGIYTTEPITDMSYMFEEEDEEEG